MLNAVEGLVNKYDHCYWDLKCRSMDQTKKCLLAYILHLFFFYPFNCFIKYVDNIIYIKECIQWINRAFLRHSVTFSYKLTSSLCKNLYLNQKRLLISRFGTYIVVLYIWIELNICNWPDMSEELETGLDKSSYNLDCPSLIYTLYSTLAAIQIAIHNNYSTSEAEKKYLF